MTDNGGETRRICTLERNCVAVQHLPGCNYIPTLETVLAKLERPGAFFTAEEVRIALAAREGQGET